MPIFDIKIQPDINKNLTNSYVIFSRNLDLEHLAGIILANRILFSSKEEAEKHLQIFYSKRQIRIYDNITKKVSINEVEFYFPNFEKKHILFSVPIVDQNEKDEDESFRDYLSRLHSNANHVQYDIMCRLIGDEQFYFCQSRTEHFLEGIISLFTWYGLDYRDYLDMIHYRDVPVRININYPE